MSAIAIATIILKKRKEKGLTQDALAQYLGVSKASVSKWETNASYPDIALLPQLATYFGISIDELMGYSPLLTREQIRDLHQRLTEQITTRPIEETLDEWREITRKYYACYPLLVVMGTFMLNALSLITEHAQRESVAQETIALFTRVREECKDAILIDQALKLEATCYLAIAQPEKALFLLEDSLKELVMPPDLLAASAYNMLGDVAQAKRILQVGLLQNLVVHFNYLFAYLPHVMDDTPAFAATVKRARSVAAAYDLASLHPLLQLTLDLTCAVGYATRGEQEEACAALESLAELLINGKQQFDLHGDTYFDLVDSWIAELDTGSVPPKSMQLIKIELVTSIDAHPAFATLKNEKRYQRVMERLESLKEEPPC